MTEDCGIWKRTWFSWVFIQSCNTYLSSADAWSSKISSSSWISHIDGRGLTLEPAFAAFHNVLSGSWIKNELKPALCCGMQMSWAAVDSPLPNTHSSGSLLLVVPKAVKFKIKTAVESVSGEAHSTQRVPSVAEKGESASWRSFTKLLISLRRVMHAVVI